MKVINTAFFQFTLSELSGQLICPNFAKIGPRWQKI